MSHLMSVFHTEYCEVNEQEIRSVARHDTIFFFCSIADRNNAAVKVI